ncbi:hypothetical protein [Lentzea flava]|uniref:DUF4440 domain-containing protein n=1 Tax=Lentzea flava TaxID=103732 RepID=A0ABQ2VG14_9PSEU|nr:hypothetical protein [Lentzea flava]MCP2204808.1 hypothetical protein [Lentzea flava]GGU81148.1 hypothetical protein GCM10010178_84830 [Lentzea flava]
MPDDRQQIIELTSLWLGDDKTDLSYIDDDLVAADHTAEDYKGTAEAEEIGGLALSSLYYNRPTVGTYNGVPHIFFYQQCLSAPRYRIQRSRIFSTITAGSCVAFRKYKMFYR